ncbi:four helix bundle protein [Cytobacillus sp. Hz8]|uniref:four helix bundle protein n=1 Tax=Cytobacillus sp. Hz8 TaxID=3347168 RepID=UPI0035D9CBC6
MKNNVDGIFVKDPKKLKVYDMCKEMNRLVYQHVKQFPWIEEKNMKIQMIKSVSSIGANLVEGNGQIYPAKEFTFINNALGSAQESRYWYDLAMMNSYITKEQFKIADDLLKEIILILIAMMKRLKNQGVA